MKLFLTSIFLISFGFVFSQEEKKTEKKNSEELTYVILNCEEGTKAAKSHFENEKFNSYSYGLPFDSEPKFTDFYEEYMKTKYKIEVRNRGCVVTEYSECYSKTMRELLLKKFGNDFFQKVVKEARELFDKQNK